MEPIATPTSQMASPPPGEASGGAGSRASRPGRRPTWPRRLLITVMGLLIASLLGVLWVFMFGRVQGTEFSPGTLTKRHFSYYEIPILRWQVTPISRQSFTGDLEKRLLNDQLISIQPDQRWDLIQASRWNESIVPNGATILLDYLEARRTRAGTTRVVWEEWTEEHPALAKVLWPEVIELARRQLYPFLPEIMKLARQASATSVASPPLEATPSAPSVPAEALRRDIALRLQSRCEEMANIQEELGNLESARQFREWGDEYGELATKFATSPHGIQQEK